VRKPNEIQGGYVGKRGRLGRDAPAHHHKSGDTGFWKPPNSWLSDSYSDPKLILLLVDVISFYSRDRTPLCLSPSETTCRARVGGDALTRRGKPFNTDKSLTFDRPSLRPRVSVRRNLLRLKDLVKARLRAPLRNHRHPYLTRTLWNHGQVYKWRNIWNELVRTSLRRSYGLVVRRHLLRHWRHKLG
jgi:hypothetical protein